MTKKKKRKKKHNQLTMKNIMKLNATLNNMDMFI